MQPEKRVNRKRAFFVSAVIIVVLLLLVITFIYTSSQSRKRQQSLLERQQTQFSKTATADPILKYLPYGGLGYNITPSFQSIQGVRTLVLQITIVLSDADYHSSKPSLQKSIAQKESNAVAYIRSLGFDPSKYKVQYLVPPH